MREVVATSLIDLLQLVQVVPSSAQALRESPSQCEIRVGSMIIL